MALLIALGSSTARADDFDEFVRARDTYINGDYDLALRQFEQLLGQDPPRVRPALLEIARKYYAAVLALTPGREDDAIAMMERIIRANPDAEFEANYFNSTVQQLMQRVRIRMQPEIPRIRQQITAARDAAQARLDEQRRILIDLTTQEVVITAVPRWPMFVPFGIGQSFNRSPALGALFAGVEIASLATALISYVVSIDQFPITGFGFGTHNPLQDQLYYANIVGWSVFGVAAIAGIVEANVAYVPEHREIRRRPPPPALRTLQIAATPMPASQGFFVAAALRF